MSDYARPLLTAAVAIGSAGLILGAPCAGLAHAAPVLAPQQFGNLGNLGNLFGSGGLSGFDAVFGFFNMVPIVNMFISNGADGTAQHPDGFNGGMLFGRGGNGFSPTTPGAN